MKVKNQWMFLVAMLMLCLTAYFLIDRMVFLYYAERTLAVVRQIEGVNESCGGRRSYSCTQFYATVDFTTLQGETSSTRQNIDDKRGHNRSTQTAKYQPLDQVPILYRPGHLAKVYLNTFSSLWGYPFMVFLLHVILLITSFSEPRSSKTQT